MTPAVNMSLSAASEDGPGLWSMMAYTLQACDRRPGPSVTAGVPQGSGSQGWEESGSRWAVRARKEECEKRQTKRGA